MLERSLTTKRCSEVVRLLIEDRKWTVARIARTIGATSDYVRRIQSREQSFQFSDVEALAKASSQSPATLIFDSYQRDRLSPEMKKLYDMGLQQIESHKEFQRAMNRAATKKQRPRTTSKRKSKAA
jgi:hypothetical protein